MMGMGVGAPDHSLAIEALKEGINRLASDTKLLRQREKESLEEAARYRNAALPLETQISAMKAAIVELGRDAVSEAINTLKRRSAELQDEVRQFELKQMALQTAKGHRAVIKGIKKKLLNVELAIGVIETTIRTFGVKKEGEA